MVTENAYLVKKNKINTCVGHFQASIVLKYL